MTLILSITSSASKIEQQLKEFIFNESGGTIGRKMSNNWVLPDENRHLSGSHAAIEYDKGNYYIVDTSTNGVFVNGDKKPVGRGERQQLEDGFQLLLGTYHIRVDIKDENSSPTRNKKEPEDLFDDLDDPVVIPDSSHQNKIPTNDVSNSTPLQSASVDPFADIGDLSTTSDSVASGINEPKDNREQNIIPEFDDFFKPAEIKKKPASFDVKETAEKKPKQKQARKTADESVIPDDWKGTSKEKEDPFEKYFSGTGDGTSDDKQEDSKSQEEALPEQEDIPVTKEQRESPPRVVEPERKTEVKDTRPDESEAISLFIKGLGVDESVLGNELSAEQLFLAGKLFRTALQGTMEVLQSRAEIKNEMRMDMTTIQPIQNNPIKFAVDINEALKKLFLLKNKSYMDPEEALKEAYDDIKSHQIAVISGIQASLVYVLKRFQPENLIERLEKESPISASIPVHRKAKLWDKFEALYDTIESEAEDDFNRLFGQEFAKAYEKQVDQLKKERDKQ